MLDRYLKLKELVEKYSYYYYEKSETLISDEEFDKLLKELEDIEKLHPEYKNQKSPTQVVGGFVNTKFTKVRHNKPMLSLANTYSIEDIKDFDTRVRKILNRPVTYVLELKLDGLSIDLQYKKGKLVLALTRGDGIFGEDVTDNVYQIQNIPKILKKDIDIEVRGEIILPISEFNRINRDREANGEQVFSNPRNAASGTIRQLDSSIVASRKLSCFLYYVINTQDFNITTHLESINLLKELGFETANVFETYTDFSSMKKAIDEWDVKRKKLDFETDGLVLKVNDLSTYDMLGYTAKSPRWAIAYKFKPDQLYTKILSVDYQVGRTGVITPVANFKPINLSGSIVKRASMHNFDEVEKKDIRIHDTILVEKAAEIIPQVVNVDFSKRTGLEEKIIEPKFCPACNEKLYKSDKLVAIKCINPFCPERIMRSIEYFTSRDCMNIKGLGEKIVKKLIDIGLITNILDIYNLHNFKNELITFDKMGQKNVDNLIGNIEKSKSNSFSTVLYSLGIPYVGKTTSNLICDNITDIDKLINASFDDLVSIKGIGDKVATSIIEYFKEKNNIRLIKGLQEIGFVLETKQKEKKYNKYISGKTFLATGTLKEFTRDEIKDIIITNGGKYLSSVSKNLNYLIVGDKAGSKLEKAKKLNIAILTEQDLLDMIK